MRSKSAFRLTVGLAFLLALVADARAQAQQETPVYSFGSGSNAGAPFGGVISDAAGNLYGTTTFSVGAVFELTPQAGGGWSETVLHTFGSGTDGNNPQAGLVMDSSGNLYGTTVSGGAYGFGIVFELTPQSGGGWTEAVLHSFGNGKDGQSPQAALVMDAAGNLYGTTLAGGNYGLGTVFELSSTGGGNWTGKFLHHFGYSTRDGASPYGGLIFDAKGNLYGTTTRGGPNDRGTVFELLPTMSGLWTEKVLHSFEATGRNGDFPMVGVILDSKGNIYGACGGGANAMGMVFELSPSSNGGWNEKVVHNFVQNGQDGRNPYGLVRDALGNLYGTTVTGGVSGFGTAYELSPAANGVWTEKVLHSFNLYGGDGAYPYGTLLLNSAGNLYGTALQGGTNENGMVYQITP